MSFLKCADVFLGEMWAGIWSIKMDCLKTESLSESENLPENGYYPAWQNPKQPDSLFFTESPATFYLLGERSGRTVCRVPVKNDAFM